MCKSVHGPSAYQPNALPLGRTGSVDFIDALVSCSVDIIDALFSCSVDIIDALVSNSVDIV